MIIETYKATMAWSRQDSSKRDEARDAPLRIQTGRQMSPIRAD
jgi:hypothetical protein